MLTYLIIGIESVAKVSRNFPDCCSIRVSLHDYKRFCKNETITTVPYPHENIIFSAVTLHCSFSRGQLTKSSRNKTLAFLGFGGNRCPKGRTIEEIVIGRCLGIILAASTSLYKHKKHVTFLYGKLWFSKWNNIIIIIWPELFFIIIRYWQHKIFSPISCWISNLNFLPVSLGNCFTTDCISNIYLV